MHAYFTGTGQHDGACPATTWTSAPKAATSWPRPPEVDGNPYQLIAKPAGRGGLRSRPSSPPSWNPSGSRNIQHRAWTSPTSRSGSPASPGETATRACSGPPTVPSTPTPPPT